MLTVHSAINTLKKWVVNDALCSRLLPSLSGFHSQLLGATSFLEKHWVQINVEPLSRQELLELVEVMVCVIFSQPCIIVGFCCTSIPTLGGIVFLSSAKISKQLYCAGF